MFKNRFKAAGRLTVLMLALSLLFLSACAGNRQKEPEEVIELYNDSVILDEYMHAVEDYDHVIYEQVYFDWGGRSIGPTEYRFRGVVYLTDEDAERLWAEYDWEQVDAPEFEFGKVDSGSLGDGPWYSCNDFNSENYTTIVPYYTVFDGGKLVFDIHQI